MTNRRVKELRRIIEKIMQRADDETVAEYSNFLPEWRESVNYEADEKVQYNDVAYKVLQPHTSTSAWNPEDAVSLFAQVLIPNEDQIYDWEQPESTNPYMTGDKVRHNGQVWVSIIDYNIYEPGIFGWIIVTI